MSLTLRPGRPEDARDCGQICYDAFATISGAHNFPPDFPSPDVAIQFMEWSLGHSGFYSIVAEENSSIVGSNFIDIRNPIAGIGPITVKPSAQNKSVGRRLMEEAQDYVSRKEFAGVRLVQAAFHNRSLSLYTKLGYETREPLVCLQGAPLGMASTDGSVRSATEKDLEACNQLCIRIHGHDRAGELKESIAQKTAKIVERNGRISGYSTVIGFFGHAVGEENSDLKALIAAATEFAGPGFLLPIRNGDLFRWCLEHGLHVVQPLNLMTRGLYNEPTGAFLPSILY